MAIIEDQYQTISEHLVGTGDDDNIYSRGGGDFVDGGGGVDTAIVLNSFNRFELIQLGAFWYLYEPGFYEDEGLTLYNVERIEFIDQIVEISSPGVSNNVIVGDYLTLSETIVGSSMNDFIFTRGGPDQVEGAGGIDTAVFTQSMADYQLSQVGPYWYLDIVEKGLFDDQGTTLRDVERVQFRDGSIALDLEGSSSAGGIYRTYQAAFDRTPDHSGLGYWIDRADNGASAVRMAEEFAWSDEFQRVYGVTTTDQYLTGNDIEAVVSQFYQNVLGREPDLEGLDFYTAMIESREGSVGRALAEIADSQENRQNVQPVIQSGIEYDLWLG